MFSATRSAASSGALEVDVGDEDEELVASEPGDDVGRPHGVAEPVGHDAEELVAGRVAVAVVHKLEVVEVDEEHGDRQVAALGARDRLLEVLLEEEAVGQVGQRVVVGQMGEPGLRGDQLVGGAAAVGDVGDDPIHEPAAVLDPRPRALPHPARDAVGADQPVLDLAAARPASAPRSTPCTSARSSGWTAASHASSSSDARPRSGRPGSSTPAPMNSLQR